MRFQGILPEANLHLVLARRHTTNCHGIPGKLKCDFLPRFQSRVVFFRNRPRVRYSSWERKRLFVLRDHQVVICVLQIPTRLENLLVGHEGFLQCLGRAFAEQPLGESLRISDFEFETEFALIKREGNGVALSFQGGYEQATGPGDNANQIGFGPIVELADGPFLVTLNPVFTRQVGPFANQEGLGFDYGWRGEYDFAKRWGVGIEMFGEIESLANSGSFNQQNHSIGPTLFYHPGGGDEGEGENGKKDESAVGLAKTEFSLNVGVQFGLTDAASDTALKFQGSLSF